MYDPTSEYYTDYAGMTLERVIANYPDYDQMDNCTDADSSSACAHLKKSKLVARHEFLAECEENGIFVYKAHAGQTYYLADAKLVILHTAEIATEAIPNAKCGHEDGDQACSNRLSVITQMILPVNGYDVTFMMTGDAESYNAYRVNELYGVAMKSDFLQAPHHGANSMGDTFYYDNVAAPYFMVPTSNNRWNGDENGGWFGDDKPLVLQYKEGRTGLKNVKYSLSEGVTTFIAGDMSHEFSLSVTDGVLSVTDISLLWCRGDIRRYMKADGNYKLIADISFDDQFCTYMDAAGDPTTFSGTLDGMGHTLTFPSELENSSALFDTLSGTVKNLNVGTEAAPVTVSFTAEEELNAGVLFSALEGEVVLSNVHLWADLDLSKAIANTNAGGFTGQVAAGATSVLVENSSVNGTIYCAHASNKAVGQSIGGFFGIVKPETETEVTLKNSVNKAAVSTNLRQASNKKVYPGVAGFIGSVTTDTTTLAIDNCVNADNISATKLSYSSSYHNGLGGFIGNAHDAKSITITNCVNKGAVNTVGNSAGGFVGYAEASTCQWSINGCINYGDVEGHRLGGIVALISGASSCDIKNCYNYGKIGTAIRQYAGGILAKDEGVGVTVENCVNLGVVEPTVVGDGPISYGDIVGVAAATTVLKNNVSLKSDKIVGTANDATVTNCVYTTVSQTNKGAGVRIVNDDKGTGLRFKFTMDEASMTALQKLVELYNVKEGDDNVQVGAIFLPTKLVGEDALTAENYSNALITEGTASAVEGGCYYASLVNLYEDHYTTAYSCQSFYRFRTSADGEWITVYANNTETRIIAKVADDALADYNDPNNENKPNYSDEQIQLLEKYAAANH